MWGKFWKINNFVQNCVTKNLMEKVCDGKFVENCQILECDHIVKFKQDGRFLGNGIIEDTNILFLQLGNFILSSSNKILKKIVSAIDGLKIDKFLHRH